MPVPITSSGLFDTDEFQVARFGTGQRMRLSARELKAYFTNIATGDSQMPNQLVSTAIDPFDTIRGKRGGLSVDLAASDLKSYAVAAMGEIDPARLGSTVKMLFDPNRPYTMDFRGARTLVAANSQSFSATTSNGSAFYSLTKFTLSVWLRMDTDNGYLGWNGSQYNATNLFGVRSSSKYAWYFTWGTNQSTSRLDFSWGDASGNFANGGSVSPFFPNASSASLNGRQWMHLFIVYDGSQADNATRLRCYLNGAYTTALTGATVPATLGNPGSASGVTFSIGGGANASPDMSWCDFGLCLGNVPGSNAASDIAAALAYNNGFGIKRAGWTSALPTLTNYWAGDNAMTDGGVAPSGNENDAVGTVNLTANNSPGGQLQVIDWRDPVNSLKAKFGYNPVTGYRRRVFEGEYSPTVRGGKPGVTVQGNRTDNGSGISGGYAYVAVDGVALLGASGSFLMSGMVTQTIATALNPVSFCDDQTQLGSAGHATRRTFGAFIAGNQNQILKAMGNRNFVGIQINNAKDGSQLTGPVDIEAYQGNETIAPPWYSQQILTIGGKNGQAVQVTTVQPHGYSTGDQVTVGVPTHSAATEANGDWTIDVLDNYNFTLRSSTRVAANAFVPGDGSNYAYPVVMRKSDADAQCPKSNVPFSFEICNNGSSAALVNWVGGPYESYVGIGGTVTKFDCWCDDGLAGNFPNVWGTYTGNLTYNTVPPTDHGYWSGAKLSCLVLGGFAEIVNGQWHISSSQGFCFGPISVLDGQATAAQRAAMRTFHANN